MRTAWGSPGTSAWRHGVPFLKYDAQCGLYQGSQTSPAARPSSSMSRPGTFQTFVAMREVACGIHTDGTNRVLAFRCLGIQSRAHAARRHLHAHGGGRGPPLRRSHRRGNPLLAALVASGERHSGVAFRRRALRRPEHGDGLRVRHSRLRNVRVLVGFGEPSARGLQTDTTATMAFDSLVFGAAYRCGLRKDGSVDCWGSLAGKAPSGRFVQSPAANTPLRRSRRRRRRLLERLPNDCAAGWVWLLPAALRG